MSDDQSDSWRFLADELGVNPEKQSAPPPTPVGNPPAAKHHSPPSSPPPKKSKSDWNALAGELGLEVSPESESESTQDHVAEILGFPPPSSFSPKRDEPQSRDQGDDYHDNEESERSADRDRWRDEDEQQRRSQMYDDTKPVYDDAHPADFEEPQPPADYRDPPHTGAERNYRSGSRRRGGRGRGRGGDRGGESRGRYGNQNRPRDSYGNRPYGQQAYDRPPQSDNYAGEDRPPVPEGPGGESPGNERSENSRSGDGPNGDDRSRRRRRRGGRGRGGRDRNQQRPPMNREPSDRPVDDHDIPYLDPIDESLLGDEHGGAAGEFETVDFSAAESKFGTGHEGFDNAPAGSASRRADHDDDHDDHELESLGDEDDLHDENNIGKASVRDILTWKEAIGMIVDGNMQSRANTPHPTHHPRGQRGGRGRGRGRGGNRR